MTTDPEHHAGFFVDVWTDVPLSEYARKTLLQAIESICLDNTEDHYEGVVVAVHEAPVLKEGPNHWEET